MSALLRLNGVTARYGEITALEEATIEVRAGEALIFRMPSDLLNANYWEPLTKENENAVREKLTGIITRTEGDQVLLWRADRIARCLGRLGWSCGRFQPRLQHLCGKWHGYPRRPRRDAADHP